MRRQLTNWIFLALTLFAFATPCFASAKDLDSVKIVYLAPVISEQDVPLFPVYLKTELVHEGFIVPPKPDKADATFTVELIVTKKGSSYEIEAHGKLEEEDFNVLWTGSVTKSGPDQDKLVLMVARQIVGKMKSAKVEAITKRQEKNEKESKQPQ